MRKRGTAKVLACALAMMVTASSVVPAQAAKAVAPTKITLNVTGKTIYKGQKFKVAVKAVKPVKATKSVKFSTNNAKVATVTQAGVVYGKGVGTAKITATSKVNSKIKASCNITVKAAPKAVKLNYTKKTLVAGATSKSLKTVALKATVTKNAYPTVKFKTSNKNVATVSAAGVVTAKKAGVATITAYSEANAKIKKTCKVTVINTPKDMRLNYGKKVLYAGSNVAIYNSVKLVAKTTTKNAYKAVTFKTSNNSIATVSAAGVVKAKKAGVAKIRAYSKANGKIKATCTVTVKAAPTKIATKYTSKTLVAGATTASLKSVNVGATTTPAVAKNTLTFSSSNPAVATVSATGVVTAKKAGTATITVSSKAKTTLKKTVKITVLAKQNLVTENDITKVITFDKKAATSYTVNANYRDADRTANLTKSAVTKFAGIVADYAVMASNTGDLAASFQSGELSMAIGDVLSSDLAMSVKDTYGYSEVTANEDGSKTITEFDENGKVVKTVDVAMANVEGNCTLTAKYSTGKVVEVNNIKSTKDNETTVLTGDATCNGYTTAVKVVVSKDGNTIKVYADDSAVLNYYNTSATSKIVVNKAKYNEISSKYGFSLKLDSVSGSNNY